jgi:hypothetical protein
MLTPALLGMVGLIVDGGLLMAAQRQAQNAADAAALAAAYDKFRGSTDSTALSTANTFLADNGLSGVSLTLNAGSSNALNIPPQDPTNTGSPHKGQSNYVEVFVTKPVTTYFIQVLGVNSSQQVTARAVAGYEPVGNGEGVFVLDPTASPGLDVGSNQGSGAFVRLRVNGDITVNSYGGGMDEWGKPVSPNTNYVSGNADAVKTQTGLSVPSIVTTQLNIAGGVSDITAVATYEPSFANNNYYDPNYNSTTHPVAANLQQTAPDPLANLATPTTSNGVTNATKGSYPQAPSGSTGTLTASANQPQNISVTNSNNYTFIPGVYQSISVTGGTATFQPGIYVVGVSANGGGSVLTFNGGTVTGSGVMFYITGSNYNASDGMPDVNDGTSSPPKNVPGNFGGLSMGGSGTTTLTPYSNTGSPFNGILFYQRRWNNQGASITGGNNTSLSGTLYAKWANFQLAGSGNFNAQFLVGSMSITGQSTVTIDATGKLLGRANVVFLVE